MGSVSGRSTLRLRIRSARGLMAARALEQLPALGAAVEKKVDRREPGDERRAAALAVRGVLEVLPGDAHAGAREFLDVEIAARAAVAREQRVGAELAADVEQQ